MTGLASQDEPHIDRWFEYSHLFCSLSIIRSYRAHSWWGLGTICAAKDQTKVGGMKNT